MTDTPTTTERLELADRLIDWLDNEPMSKPPFDAIRKAADALRPHPVPSQGVNGDLLAACRHALKLLEPFADQELSLGLGSNALTPIRAAISKAEAPTAEVGEREEVARLLAAWAAQERSYAAHFGTGCGMIVGLAEDAATLLRTAVPGVGEEELAAIKTLCDHASAMEYERLPGDFEQFGESGCIQNVRAILQRIQRGNG